MAALPDGIKEVKLTATAEPKAKRQSFRAAVKKLGERLDAKRKDLEKLKWQLEHATEAHKTAEAEVFALQDAYDLVKPQPRTRRKA